MNQFQLAFLIALVLPFALLCYLSSFIRSTGFDLSRLILIGLDDPDAPIMSLDPLFAALKSLEAIDIPFVGTTNFVELAKAPHVVITAAIVLAAAIYAKGFHTGRSKPLDPKQWKDFLLEKKIQVSPNTALYRFKLPRKDDVLGLPTGQHISISANINGKNIIRSYTPVSNDDDRGYFDLLIKTYEKGNISKHVSTLKIGDAIHVKGPRGNFQYSVGMAQHISMIAGGTGITPMIQIIRTALKNPFDTTTISLIYANINEEDILLRDDLEELQDVHGVAKFKIYYVLNNPPPGWKGGVGFVTREHIHSQFPDPSTPNTKLLMCGPPPMISAMKKHLEELKYPAPRAVSKPVDQVFVF